MKDSLPLKDLLSRIAFQQKGINAVFLYVLIKDMKEKQWSKILQKNFKILITMNTDHFWEIWTIQRNKKINLTTKGEIE